jgi:hypothetical protein
MAKLTYEFDAEVFADDATKLCRLVEQAVDGGRDASPYYPAHCRHEGGDRFRLVVPNSQDADRHVAGAVDGVFDREHIVGSSPRRIATPVPPPSPPDA